MATWAQLASGGRIDLPIPKPGQITLDDLAHHLSRNNRFAGAIKLDHYSVAEHCIRAAMVATRLNAPPRVRLLALMHDAGEIIGDIIRPIKDCLSLQAYHEIKALEHSVEKAAFRDLMPTVSFEPGDSNIVKQIDDWLMWEEGHRVLHGGTTTWTDHPPVYLPVEFDNLIKDPIGMSPNAAKHEFITLFNVLHTVVVMGRSLRVAG